MSYLYTSFIDPNICIGNTLSTFNANFLALDEQLQTINNYGEERVAFAWGLYNTSTSAMENDGSYNLSGTTQSVGQYKFTFGTANTNDSYIVLLNASSTNTNNALKGQNGYTHTKTTTAFEVDWGLLSANYDPEFLDILVYSI